jgi:hypothetical protein
MSGDTTLVERDDGKKIWTIMPRELHITREPHIIHVRETYSLDALTVYPCPPVWYRADFAMVNELSSSSRRDVDPALMTAHGEHTCDMRLASVPPGTLPDANCFTCAMNGRVFRWQNPMFMHRRHTRIALKVTMARLMRLQDITTSDAIDEGCLFTNYGHHDHQISADGGETYHITRTPKPGWSYGPSTYSDMCLGSARMAYASAWNDIHGRKRNSPDPWDLNPWVWAYTFKRIR